MRTALALLIATLLGACAAGSRNVDSTQATPDTQSRQASLAAYKKAQADAQDVAQYDLGRFKSCASEYVLAHRASRLTASELTEAALGACNQFEGELNKDLSAVYQMTMASSGVRHPPPDGERQFVEPTIAKCLEIVREYALQALADAE